MKCSSWLGLKRRRAKSKRATSSTSYQPIIETET
jgi:hypothetical protein